MNHAKRIDGAMPVSSPPDRAASGSPTYWENVWRRLSRDPITLISAGLLVAIVLSAIFAPLLAPYAPQEGQITARLRPIASAGHLLGTDETGRDMLSRLLYGGRTSLLSGLLPVAVALVIGGGLGVLAGFRGGLTNKLIMRSMDVFFAFPSTLLAIAIVGTLGTGLFNTLLSLTLVFIPQLTRISESVTTQVRNMDFIEAARATGASSATIIRHHVLANVLGPILVYATSLVSLSIIIAAGLSFLGLGVSSPTAEWGLMLNSLRQAIYVDAALAALPGAMIFITSMCFNLISDGLRTAMDMRINVEAAR